MQPTETPERTEIVEYYVSKGSVPSVPRSTALELAKPPRARGILDVLRRTVTSNLLLSLIVIVAHLALAVPWANLAAVTIIISSRGQDVGATHNFTPLTLYFLTTAANGGSDSNDGLAPTVSGGHGPWLTPNGHAVNCGDVILVQAGSYGTSGGGSPFSFTTPNWGPVSNCPSTTGGIDGTGGIYAAILLCAGSDLMSCQVNGFPGPAFFPNAPTGKGNWAIEGFWATQDYTGLGGCYDGENDPSNNGSSTPANYLFFINDIATHCDLAGFTITTNLATGGSWDHVATIGIVAFDGANSSGGGGNCGSNLALNAVPSGSDTGTHLFTAGYFGYLGMNAPTGSVCFGATGSTWNSDGEGIIWDSIGGSSYNHQIVVENSVMWKNGSSCIEFFPAGATAANDQAQYIIQNVTCYSNVNDPDHLSQAELSMNGISPSSGGSYSVTNSIFLTPYICQGGVTGANCNSNPQAGFCTPANTAVCAAAAYLYTFNGTQLWATYSPSVNVSNNYIFDSHAPTTNTTGGNNTVSGDSSGRVPWPLGTNTYADPGLANPGALPTTTPNCTGYKKVYDCMVGLGVISAIANSTGVGYQSPGSCASDPLFPTWAKGLDHLEASGFTLGATITEVYGNITRPCNM